MTVPALLGMLIDVTHQPRRLACRPPLTSAWNVTGHEAYRYATISRGEGRPQRQARLPLELWCGRNERDPPPGTPRAHDLTELRVQVPQPITVTDANAVRRVRDDPARPIHRRVDGGDRTLRELDVREHACTVGVRSGSVHRSRIPIRCQNWRRRRRENCGLRISQDGAPRSLVEIRPAGEREVASQPRRYPSREERTFYGNGARPTHRVQQRCVSIPSTRQKRCGRERFAQRCAPYCLTIATEMEKRPRAVDAHRALIVKQPHDDELLPRVGGVGFISRVANESRVANARRDCGRYTRRNSIGMVEPRLPTCDAQRDVKVGRHECLPRDLPRAAFELVKRCRAKRADASDHSARGPKMEVGRVQELPRGAERDAAGNGLRIARAEPLELAERQLLEPRSRNGKCCVRRLRAHV